CRENYNYFYRLYSMGTTPRNDFEAPANDPAQAQKPTIPPVNLNVDGTNKSAYIQQGDLTINSDWILSGSESIVIFVNGNLNVTNNAHITVPSGTFLAFIVSGDITFDSTIGETDPASQVA